MCIRRIAMADHCKPGAQRVRSSRQSRKSSSGIERAIWEKSLHSKRQRDQFVSKSADITHTLTPI